MNLKEVFDNVSTKKCFMCQNNLKKIDCSNEQNAIPHILFVCPTDEKHYKMFISLGSFDVEEQVHIFVDDKEYRITQYWDDNHVLINTFDKEGEYLCSSGIDLESLAFDFLNSDLEKNVSRLKFVLTFQ